MLLGLLALTLPLAARPQEATDDRSPAVAGQFYPAGRQELTRTLTDLFRQGGQPLKGSQVRALIVPHAGYVYSGGVAAAAYAAVEPEADIENVVILGPSHQVGFEGASVYAAGDYVTPLGRAAVSRELARALLAGGAPFTDRTDAHRLEHSVEVQIPFIQYHFRKKPRIVPIVLGQNPPATARKIAAALRPYLTPRNLFVISTDFSHYPSYEDAKVVDGACAEAILSNSTDNLLRVLRENQAAGVPGLATSMCGWTAVFTLLAMTEEAPGMQYRVVRYRNSGDAPGGRKSEVVGYYAIALTAAGPPSGEVDLSDREKSRLLEIARSSIADYLTAGKLPRIDPSGLSAGMKSRCGAFVTLKKDGELRGCIGRFDAGDELYRVVQEMAIAAATEDHRFPPVHGEELRSIALEISVLTPLRRIASAAEYDPAKHGIYLRKGNRSGTFLPQVAGETGWGREEMLGHCARDKAGIGWDGWKEAELYVYEAIVFGERETGAR
jgi:AmmeMemoRadiSam system protein B/AmmeMemoRadiSam system protein A